MLRLLIVDDERLVRELIRLCVDWEEIGFEIVGTAATAEEGIVLVEELRPDVVFTDVRMPGQTGLDLARIVLDKYPEIKVVVISGYDEFAYVNEGLKIGIFDYLLKPIAEEALQAVGCKVRDAVLEERKHAAEFEHYKKEFEQNYESIREKAISRLVTSKDVELVAENLKVFHLELQENCFQAAILEYGLDEEYENEQDLMESIRIREVVSRFFEAYENIWVFESRYQHIGIVHNQPGIDFYDLCVKLSRELAGQIPVNIRIGVGGFYTDLRQLSVSYREAHDALKYSYTRKTGSCITYQEVRRNTDQLDGIWESMFKNYSYYICQGMIREASEIVEETFENMQQQNLSRDQAVFQSVNYVIETFAAAAEIKIPLGELEGMRTQIIARIMGYSDLKDMKACIRELLDQIFDALRRENETKSVSVVETVEAFVKEHYCSPDISLAQMAAMVYTNPNYLSRAFKKKTGKTFREYLLDLRMENAMILLRQTSLKSYEIADKVGIRDPNYFSVCFKKKFGYSVQDLDRSK